eukprot:515550-Pyramimonas_sp.AAC.1
MMLHELSRNGHAKFAFQSLQLANLLFESAIAQNIRGGDNQTFALWAALHMPARTGAAAPYSC